MADVLIRNPSTGEERTVAATAVPFFPAFEPVTAAEQAPDEPEISADSGVSTTTITLEEN